VRHDGGATFTGSTIVMKESAAKRSIGTITRCLYDVHIPWSGQLRRRSVGGGQASMTMLSSWLCWIASKRPAAVDDGRSWRVLLGERPRSPPSASLWADATQLELERPKGHPSPCQPLPAIDSVTPSTTGVPRRGPAPDPSAWPVWQSLGLPCPACCCECSDYSAWFVSPGPCRRERHPGSEGCHGAVVGAVGRHLDAVVLVTVVGPGVRLDAGRRNCAKGS